VQRKKGREATGLSLLGEQNTLSEKKQKRASLVGNSGVER